MVMTSNQPYSQLISDKQHNPQTPVGYPHPSLGPSPVPSAYPEGREAQQEPRTTLMRKIGKIRTNRTSPMAEQTNIVFLRLLFVCHFPKMLKVNIKRGTKLSDWESSSLAPLDL